MAWSTPRTWTTGEIVTKTIMDTHVRDNLNAVYSSLGSSSTHSASTLSATVHPNTSFCNVAPTAAQGNIETGIYCRVEFDNEITDTGSNFVSGEKWYNQVQADADSSATSIEDDNGDFTNAKCRYSLVTWSSDAGGTLNIGTGYVTAVDTDTLTINKCSGDDFAASYYYTINKTYYNCPTAGVYLVSATVQWLNTAAESDAAYSVIVLAAGNIYLFASTAGEAGQYLYNNISCPYLAAANANISIVVYHTAAGNQTVSTGYSRFQVARLYGV